MRGEFGVLCELFIAESSNSWLVAYRTLSTQNFQMYFVILNTFQPTV